ncbi:CotS family spore coat protein [Clostridium thermarum]|uniref:CotS family spore coat protein n=1 Tax=Clostridium thermarum TaxID=1716543 RepID=UPI00111FC647|nr:CotS family spore coat protein [Clostridium thermarum]
MDTAFVKRIVEEKYGISAVTVEKIKNVYQICDEQGKYCLKVIKYELPHFLFILGTINHLIDKGFTSVLQIINTLDRKQYIALDNKYAYLTPWVEARESNYDNPLDIEKATLTLAKLHIKSTGFELQDFMKPRMGWFKWFDNFRTRKNEILDFKSRIDAKEEKTEFDSIYIAHMEEELKRCDVAIKNLGESEYYIKMTKEIRSRGFCHHDFAHHNVLIGIDERVNIIDFDYVILDTHLHDLSSLLIRRMKNGKWDIENARSILEAYDSLYPVEEDDIPIMAAFMEFPQDYWQVGIQYYWEEQPWGEDFFLKKLGRILDDNEEKQEFIDEFRTFRFKRKGGVLIE